MLNRNSFRTSLLFLGIILFAIVLRMFVVGDEVFVNNDPKNEVANVNCVTTGNC